MSLQISNIANEKISQALSERGQGLGIRIGVKTTGCSGLAYVLEYVDHPHEDDKVIEMPNYKVFIDPKSEVYLQEVIVDYTSEDFKEGFDFINPKEKSRCGCGESFVV